MYFNEHLLRMSLLVWGQWGSVNTASSVSVGKAGGEKQVCRARELTQLSLEGETPAVLIRTMAEGWTRWTTDGESHQLEQGELIALKKQIAKKQG